MPEDRDIYTDFMRRDQTEKERLDNQFELICVALGYTLHPSVQARLPQNPAIADIATGTGVFLNYVSRDRTCARLDGFDISSAMFPAPESLPQHMTFKVADAKQPFPDELHGMYDLVHVRYLTLGMNEEDWAPVASNLAALLKPGGALQWEEPDLRVVPILRAEPHSTVAALRKGNQLFRGPSLDLRLAHGASQLESVLKNLGLEVETDIVSTDRVPTTRKALTANGATGIMGGAKTLVAKGTMNEADVAELEKGLRADIESGGYFRYDVRVAVGFKKA